MSVITLHLHDRFGNQLFQYCYARGYAERVGAQLQTTPWIGQHIFEINDPPIEKKFPHRYDMDLEKWVGETNIDLTGWGLHQKCLCYTRTQAKTWLTFKPWVRQALANTPSAEIAAHLRHGDFLTIMNYIAISRESYLQAWHDHSLPGENLQFVSEDNPTIEEELVRAGLGFLPDFFTLMRAKILLRANSSFSWWAATLGDNERVFAPLLKGIKPKSGKLQEVPFVEGNWPAISCLHPNCSDLHLAP